LKALSLIQPWATLVVLGDKQVETRSWKTDYRGRVAVHASKNFPATARAFAFAGAAARPLARHDLDPHDLPRGAIIGTVEIVDVLPAHQVESDLTETELALGNFGPDRFAWILAYPRQIEPIPYKGALGLFEVPDHESLLA
jgi:hypothetical protein